MERLNLLLVGFLIVLWWVSLWGLIETILHPFIKGSPGRALAVYGTLFVVVAGILFVNPDWVEYFVWTGYSWCFNAQSPLSVFQYSFPFLSTYTEICSFVKGWIRLTKESPVPVVILLIDLFFQPIHKIERETPFGTKVVPSAREVASLSILHGTISQGFGCVCDVPRNSMQWTGEFLQAILSWRQPSAYRLRRVFIPKKRIQLAHRIFQYEVV